jgi:hypothetical protein
MTSIEDSDALCKFGLTCRLFGNKNAHIDASPEWGRFTAGIEILTSIEKVAQLTEGNDARSQAGVLKNIVFPSVRL